MLDSALELWGRNFAFVLSTFQSIHHRVLNSFRRLTNNRAETQDT